MRAKAQDSGKLQSSDQQTVKTEQVQNKSVIVIEPASPDVVYEPIYDPVAIWGAPLYYPYPPVYYPPGYVAASAISFGLGVAIGAAWGGGGWGWNCGWGGNNIVINNNNAFVNHYNQNRINGGNRYAGANNRWQHNPAHRGGAPYGDRATAQRFAGAARGDTGAARQAAARQNIGRMQGAAGNARPNAGGGIGSANRSAAGGGIGSVGNGMGGDRIGNRQTSRGPGGGAFGGAASGMSGANARQSVQRGRSSMGGGFSRGGGMRGGGMRGGRRR
jgi:hypothetical protein